MPKTQFWQRVTGRNTPQVHSPRQASGATIASAALVPDRKIDPIKAIGGWQEEVWRHYRRCPELRYAVSYLANSVSRARLFVGTIDNADNDPDPVDNTTITDIFNQFFGGPNGWSQMLRRVVTHIKTIGETYWVGIDPEDSNEATQWYVVSPSEFERGPSKSIRVSDPLYGDGSLIKLQEGQYSIHRIWDPNPEKVWEPESSARGALEVLREIEKTDAHIISTLESRLAGAGLLVVPNEVTVPDVEPDPSKRLHPDPFIDALIRSAITPLRDPSSVSSRVPLVAQVPQELIEAIKHITFDNALDERILPLREAAIRRLATSMDVPTDILLGLGDTNHWSAWQLEESAVKLHVEPMLALICSAITTQYLRPALKAANIANPDQYVVWWDIAELVQRPNRGPEAIQLYDRLELSGEALRRETGFNEDDAPDELERQQRLALQLLQSNAALAPYLLPALGLPAPSAIPQEPQITRIPQSPPPRIPSARPEIPQRPAQDSPQASLMTAAVATATATIPDPVTHWQLTAAEMATYIALERYGKRLLGNRTLRSQYRNVPPWNLHTVVECPPTTDIDGTLEDVYQALAAAAPQHLQLRKTVEKYVRVLIQSRLAHKRDNLLSVLEREGCLDGTTYDG